MNEDVTIVIPTWNRKDLLSDCLRSIERQTFQSFEVIVVDDGSTDGTAELIEERFPYVRLVRLPANRGFCVAANAGIRAALHETAPEGGCEFILLLNNDVTLEPDCLMRMVEAANLSHADLLAPLLLFRDDPDVLYAAGDRQLASGRPESIGFREPHAGFRVPGTVFGVSGAAGLYRRQVFEQVGLLDEWFTAYFEDSDLNFRARLRGFRTCVVCAARAYHVGSASIEGRTWWRARQCFRNHALLALKNMPARLMLRHGRAIAAEHLHQWWCAFTAARAEFGALRAVGIMALASCSILAAFPHVFVERRRIQRARTVELDALDELLTQPNGGDERDE